MLKILNSCLYLVSASVDFYWSETMEMSLSQRAWKHSMHRMYADVEVYPLDARPNSFSLDLKSMISSADTKVPAPVVAVLGGRKIKQDS